MTLFDFAININAPREIYLEKHLTAHPLLFLNKYGSKSIVSINFISVVKADSCLLKELEQKS